MSVLKGDTVVVQYLSGEWSPWQGGEFDAAGDPGTTNGSNILPGFPHASLVGRVGDGDIVFIGNGATFGAETDGTLVLRINDKRVEDNSGSIRARVEVWIPGESVISPSLVLTEDRVHVRQGPGTNYDIIGTASAGQRYTITGRNPDTTWWQIDFEGQAGWVFGELVDSEGDETVTVVDDIPPPPPGRYPAPDLLSPDDGAVFETGEDNPPTLKWTAVGALGPDEYYVVTIPHTMGIDEQWTKDTSLTLPRYLFRLGFSDRRYEWDVRVKLHTGTKPNGGMDGVDRGEVSESRTFVWQNPGNAPIYPIGDVNHDCVVDETDLNVVLAAMFKECGDPDYDGRADLNGDCLIDGTDLSIVHGHYGERCP